MFLYIVLCLFFKTIHSSTIVLKPEPSKQGQESVLVLLHGANIDPKNYELFGTTLQKNFNGKLWVSILGGFPLNVPEPLLIDSSIKNAIETLIKSGCNINKNMPFFMAGHSLGGAIIQEYVLHDQSFHKEFPGRFTGLILEGSYILRRNRLLAQSIPQPILTIGGELDGLCRITRLAESYYFDNQTGKDMTLIIEGMNHYQFVANGEEPSFVKIHDLQAEISNDEALQFLSEVVSNFMSRVIGNIQINNRLNYQIRITDTLLNPIVNMFKLEGNYYLNPPCYKDKDNKDCTIGSKWTELAQNVYAGTCNVSIIARDEFHPTTQLIPDYLPKIHNKCSQPFSCTLKVSTYTQNHYSFEDEFDVTLNPLSATQLVSKLTSVQSILYAATAKKYDFNTTDGISLCALVNNQAIQIALKETPTKTINRYFSKGRRLVVGEDKVQNFFPIWLEEPLSFQVKVNDTTKETYTELRSATMKFPLDYFIKISAGFHFCKLLSPARAIEWIYVDSLKK